MVPTSSRTCLTALAAATFWVAVAADAVAQGNTASDRAALEAIYRATGGDDWTNNSNWLSGAPLKDWSGVEVDRRPRHWAASRRLGRVRQEDRRQRVDRVASSGTRDSLGVGVAVGRGEQRVDRPHPRGVGQSREPRVTESAGELADGSDPGGAGTV